MKEFVVRDISKSGASMVRGTALTRAAALSAMNSEKNRHAI